MEQHQTSVDAAMSVISASNNVFSTDKFQKRVNLLALQPSGNPSISFQAVGVHWFVVPSSANTIMVTMAGACGGSGVDHSTLHSGGNGGLVNATLSVSPGCVYRRNGRFANNLRYSYQHCRGIQWWWRNGLRWISSRQWGRRGCI